MKKLSLLSLLFVFILSSCVKNVTITELNAESEIYKLSTSMEIEMNNFSNEVVYSAIEIHSFNKLTNTKETYSFKDIQEKALASKLSDSKVSVKYKGPSLENPEVVLDADLVVSVVSCNNGKKCLKIQGPGKLIKNHLITPFTFDHLELL